jgi:[acyl-carrier-protein] S-malonyltransferase
MADDSVAFIFPGQGSQHVGMGKNLVENYPEARKIFEEADDLLSFKLSKLCFEGPQAELNDTINAQPALLVTSIAALRVWESKTGLTPKVVAGHSVGEYAALVAASSMNFTEALKLVWERGRLMKKAGSSNPGGMMAVIGADLARVELLCNQIQDEFGVTVQVANDNCTGQIVIAGHKLALEKFSELKKEAGAKMVIPLSVSVACHTDLMSSVQEEFNVVLYTMDIKSAVIPICANMTAELIQSIPEIRRELQTQLAGRVRWFQSVLRMKEIGIYKYVELGAKDTLSGMIKRIDPGVTCIQVGDDEDWRTIL